MIPLGILATTAGGAAPAYELISTAYGTGSSGTITFSSIPADYKHLQVRYAVRSTITATPGDNLIFRVNNVSSATYARHNLKGNGSNVTSINLASTSALGVVGIPAATATANIYASGIIDILDYASTTKNKTVRILSGQNAPTVDIWLSSGLYISTTAISSLEFSSGSGFTTPTRFSLYGIKG